VDQTLLMIGGVVLVLVLMVLPQWQARRRQKKQMEQLGVGTKVMTIGGIIGTITYLNREENRARIEIAPGVEIQVLVNAIGQPLEPSKAEEPSDMPSEEPSEE
jgi:preprotein translocase subunit YajC